MRRSRLECVRGGRRLTVLVAAAAGVALCLSGPSAAPAQVPPPATRPTSQVVGTLLDRQTGEPVSAARIVLLDPGTSTPLAAAVSDSEGGFVLASVAPGTYGLRVEVLGYRAVRDTLTLSEGEDEVFTIHLAPEAIDLEPLVVRVPRTTAYYMRDFEKRRAMGSGTFITRKQIERRRVSQTSELLHSLGGVRLQYGRQGEASLFVRGTCRPAVFVDGVAIHPSVSIDMAVIPEDIEGIEVYSNAAIPAQYASQSACAAILVWTRPAVRTEGRKVAWWKLALSGGVLLTLLIVRH
jgi:hypothetical protein